MSVMSAAEAGETPDAGQEILPRGPRMAASSAGQDGSGAEAGSRAERSAQSDSVTPARRERRLRLVSTEVHVTRVRVAREVSTRTVRADAPGTGLDGSQGRTVRADTRGTGLDGSRVSVPQPRGPRVDLRLPGEPSVQRVRLQRASAERVTVRQASVQPGGLRLTRRGRRVLTACVMLVVIISAMLIWTSVAGGAQAPGSGSPAPSVYQGMTQIVVQPGQTLWSIAIAADPSAAPWSAVQQIINANALNGAQIAAGQLLWVPRG